MHCFVACLVVSLCAVQAILGQDCSTEQGRIEFVENGARNSPLCYNPIINLVASEREPTATEVALICRENCVGEILSFLTSTEKCRNDQDVQEVVYFLQNELCAYRDGEDSPETSCALIDEGIDQPISACLAWWDSEDSRCPSRLLDGVPSSAPPCAQALQAAVVQYGCCLSNLFGSEERLHEIAEDYIPQGSVPEDFNLEETIPALFTACGVALPSMCPSSVSAVGPTSGTTATGATTRGTTATGATTRGTTATGATTRGTTATGATTRGTTATGATTRGTTATGATDTASSSSGLVTTPLLALLSTIIVKLGSF